MDEAGIMLCKYQARLFEYATKQKVPSKRFINKFAFSDLAARMDSISFLYEVEDVPQAFDEIKIKKANNVSSLFRSDIMSWIGYIYRYICYQYETPMKEIYKKIHPQELYDVFDAYHSLDNELAIKRILEAKGLVFEKKDDIEKLKRIYGM